jgi:hypothetical protein
MINIEAYSHEHPPASVKETMAKEEQCQKEEGSTC